MNGFECFETRYFSLQISHESLLTMESHFSMQVLWINPTDPEHEHGDISSSESPSWQILQNRPDEFLLAESVLLSLANDEDIMGESADGEMELQSVELWGGFMRGPSTKDSFSIPVL